MNACCARRALFRLRNVALALATGCAGQAAPLRQHPSAPRRATLPRARTRACSGRRKHGLTTERRRVGGVSERAGTRRRRTDSGQSPARATRRGPGHAHRRRRQLTRWQGAVSPRARTTISGIPRVLPAGRRRVDGRKLRGGPQDCSRRRTADARATRTKIRARVSECMALAFGKVQFETEGRPHGRQLFGHVQRWVAVSRADQRTKRENGIAPARPATRRRSGA